MNAQQLVSRLMVTTQDGRKLQARIEPDATDSRVVFSGGRWGEASIWLSVSPVARIAAHWTGYCCANGASAHPAAGSLVSFKRGMFGLWSGRVVSAGPTSCVIAYTTSRGYKAQRRVATRDIQF